MEGYKGRPDADRKSFARFRHRPHSNPLNDNDMPLPCDHPDAFPFDRFYPGIPAHVRGFDLVDIGCGYGDFVCKMGLQFPARCFLGLEIRDKPALIGQQAIIDARTRDGAPNNAAVLRCNAMKHLPRILARASVSVVTVMFADPQFKTSNVRRRVLSVPLLSEYAYYMRPGAALVTCTDVQALHEYTAECVDRHPLFARVSLPLAEGALQAAGSDLACVRECVPAVLVCMEQTADADRNRRKGTGVVYKGLWIRK